MQALIRVGDWADNAACTSHPPELFDEPLGSQPPNPTAVTICATCPVRQACLDHAFKHWESGIWAGTTARQRSLMRSSKARALMRAKPPQLAD